MPDDPRVQQLLEELLDSDSTPEEVCGPYPELLPQVRARWRQMCEARAELDALFPPMLETGTALPDNIRLPVIPGYEVEAVLGLGGMGVVFRARHLRLNRVVALKMALAGVYAGTHERERFQREAEAVAILRHPNVVQIHDVGDSDGRPYFTMEFVDGGSLAQKLAGTPLPGRDAATFLATLARAVHAAHKGGIVHRDLKPANILLTSDGTLKISDFGLARRLSGEAGLTRTGAAVGTPSYMAPEQARGKADSVGPSADIYALGAMLYEMLTGRPPFRAETAAETMHQLLTQDPVPPSRLNGKVPRDLETICLKCLQKESRLRYATAEALADDLDHFLRGEAISARPEGRLRRFIRRLLRRPVLSAAIAIATISTVTLIGYWLWTLSVRAANEQAASVEQATMERAADEDLQDMVRWLKKSAWPDATAALERATVRLGERGSNDLHRRIAKGERELILARRLEAVRLERAVSTGDFPDWKRSAGEYEAVFRETGLAQLHEDLGVVADRINGLDIRAAVTDALDDWAHCVDVVDMHAHAWLLTVAGRVDPDSSEWRAKARAQKHWPAEAATAVLAEAGLQAERCDPLLLGLGHDISFNFKDPIPFLTRVQQAHPGDLFANLELAETLIQRNRPEDSVRYYQAALAVRPDAVSVYNKLGLVLGRLGRQEEAIDCLRRAVRFSPATPDFRRNLVLALLDARLVDEALEQARLALREVPETARSQASVWEAFLDVPGPARLHATLGDALTAAGREPEALDEYRRAVALEPALREALNPLRELLFRSGRFEEARAAWCAALESHSSGHNSRYGYAELCLFLGREADYRRERQSLLSKFSGNGYPAVAERTARACLLLPATGDELLKAADLANRAAALDRAKAGGSYPFFQFARGLAEYRQGRFDLAISTMRGDASGVLGPAPRLVLAMALHQTRQEAEARKTLAAAILSHDWRASRVKDQDDWIFHVLRREAEGMIVPNLQAFLEGKYQPSDNEERVALLGVCQFTNRSAALARLYTDIFAADPRVAEDLRAGHRFSAARAAALIGCGRSQDAGGLDDLERAQFRKQARNWLRADLAARSKVLDANNPSAAAIDSLRLRLTQWRTDPDLAGLREPSELDKLPVNDRKDCLALWVEVEAQLSRCGKAK